MSFDLSTLEHAFRDVDADVTDALHTKIGEIVRSAATEIIALLPDGAAVEAFIAKLEAAAAEAHKLAPVTVAATKAAPTGLTTTESAASTASAQTAESVPEAPATGADAPPVDPPPVEVPGAPAATEAPTA